MEMIAALLILFPILLKVAMTVGVVASSIGEISIGKASKASLPIFGGQFNRPHTGYTVPSFIPIFTRSLYGIDVCKLLQIPNEAQKPQQCCRIG